MLCVCLCLSHYVSQYVYVFAPVSCRSLYGSCDPRAPLTSSARCISSYVCQRGCDHHHPPPCFSFLCSPLRLQTNSGHYFDVGALQTAKPKGAHDSYLEVGGNGAGDGACSRQSGGEGGQGTQHLQAADGAYLDIANANGDEDEDESYMQIEAAMR